MLEAVKILLLLFFIEIVIIVCFLGISVGWFNVIVMSVVLGIVLVLFGVVVVIVGLVLEIIFGGGLLFLLL